MCAVLKMVRDKEVIPEGMGVTFLSVFHFLVYASDLIMLQKKENNEERKYEEECKENDALAAAGILAAGALTGCGGGADTAKTEGAAASGEKKILKVAMECAYAPYNWTQPDDSNGAVPISGSNEYAYGYDVMMAKKSVRSWDMTLRLCVWIGIL